MLGAVIHQISNSCSDASQFLHFPDPQSIHRLWPEVHSPRPESQLPNAFLDSGRVIIHHAMDQSVLEDKKTKKKTKQKGAGREV